MVPWKRSSAGLAPPLLEAAGLKYFHNPLRTDPLLFHDQLQRALKRLEFPRQIEIQIQYTVLLLQHVNRIRGGWLFQLKRIHKFVDAVLFSANFLYICIIPNIQEFTVIFFARKS